MPISPPQCSTGVGGAGLVSVDPASAPYKALADMAACKSGERTTKKEVCDSFFVTLCCYPDCTALYSAQLSSLRCYPDCAVVSSLHCNPRCILLSLHLILATISSSLHLILAASCSLASGPYALTSHSRNTFGHELRTRLSAQ